MSSDAGRILVALVIAVFDGALLLAFVAAGFHRTWWRSRLSFRLYGVVFIPMMIAAAIGAIVTDYPNAWLVSVVFLTLIVYALYGPILSEALFRWRRQQRWMSRSR